ncbi:hypothetical protein [Pseudomonas tohonis]|uniref:hypothetical protein n=1 Tax=Pseudomonas tohonis TaxID=2725477 RepID=UPI0021DB4C55|nr:hypothetical protein [Pseudomonas tohonis]UXY51185.1 hypothetical protein N9L84_19715 [Pseudomonas tohonis]
MCDAIHLPMFWGQDPRIDYRGTLALSDVLPAVGSTTFARFSDRYLRVGECLSVIWCPPYSDINGWDEQPSEILLSHFLNVRVVATGDQVSLPASPLNSLTDGRYRYELEVLSCVPFGALLAGLQGDQAPWELVTVEADKGTKILDGDSWTAKARVGQFVYLFAASYESRVELILDVQGAEVFGLFQAYLCPGGDDFYIGRKRLQGAELEAVRSALQVATLLTDTSADYLDVST